MLPTSSEFERAGGGGFCCTSPNVPNVFQHSGDDARSFVAQSTKKFQKVMRTFGWNVRFKELALAK
jgi:hypothetical protein